MKFSPKAMRYEHRFKSIDSHTMGEATRIVYEGFPELLGNTMMEKKQYLEEHYDHYRKALMLEPRGHRDMFGALLTEPVHEEADIGVIFMDSGGYLNMCGHGSIGTASMAVETGLIEVKEPYTEVVLDAPSGIIRTKVHVKDKKAIDVSILNVPSFLYKKNLQVEVQRYGIISYDISFGGSFFALVDADQIGLRLTQENIEEITDLGMNLRKKINQTQDIRHPYLDITTVDLVEFYTHHCSKNADMKNCVIFGGAQADRSPCGTGTSAKIATLYAKNELELNKPFFYESITGAIFRGEATKEVEIDGKKGVIPQITGSAYMTGMNTWYLDEDDALEYGFSLGVVEEKQEESLRGRIVKEAWKLFREIGYEKTSMEQLCRNANISLEELELVFPKKENLLDTLGELFDQKYSELMVEMNPRLSHYDKLIYLNQELFEMIENKIPSELLKFTYIQSAGEERQHILDPQRLYYQFITQIFQEGQEQGEFKKEDNPQMMTEIYAELERGMIYNWCVSGMRTSLAENGRQLLPIYLKEFLLSSNNTPIRLQA